MPQALHRTFSLSSNATVVLPAEKINRPLAFEINLVFCSHVLLSNFSLKSSKKNKKTCFAEGLPTLVFSHRPLQGPSPAGGATPTHPKPLPGRCSNKPFHHRHQTPGLIFKEVRVCVAVVSLGRRPSLSPRARNVMGSKGSGATGPGTPKMREGFDASKQPPKQHLQLRKSRTGTVKDPTHYLFVASHGHGTN